MFNPGYSIDGHYPSPSHARPASPGPIYVDPRTPEEKEADLAAERVTRENQTRAILGRLEGLPADMISVAESRRADRLMAQTGTDSGYMTASMMLLDVPFRRGPQAMQSAKNRREALATLISLSVGYDNNTALRLVDAARARPVQDIAVFVAQYIAVSSIGSACATMSIMAASKCAAIAGAKFGLVHAGGLTVAGTAGTAAAGTALVVASGGLALVGGAVVGCTIACNLQVISNNWELFERTFDKDRRILQAILEGHQVRKSPCPENERGPF